MLANPKTWQLLSSLLLVVFVVALIVGPGVPGWGWLAFLGSGIAFAIELALKRRASE